jgi:hypothetical protein
MDFHHALHGIEELDLDIFLQQEEASPAEYSRQIKLE